MKKAAALLAFLGTLGSAWALPPGVMPKDCKPVKRPHGLVMECPDGKGGKVEVPVRHWDGRKVRWQKGGPPKAPEKQPGK